MTGLTLPLRFQLRGGTAADLASANEVPLDRELVVERDTGKGKIGDGVTPYNDLEYTPIAAPVELRKTVTDLEWRAVGGSMWQQLLPLSDIKGEDGVAGVDGPAGADGRDTEFQINSTHIQWRPVGSSTWMDLIALSVLTGADGRQVELRSNATHLQWQYVGDPGWTDLIARDLLKGDTGEPGPSSSCFPTASFDGGLGDIVIGAFCDLFIPFGFTINKATLLGNDAGSLQIDIRVCSYSDHPSGPADTICGGSPPTLVGASRVQDSALSGWTTTIAAGSSMRFIVTSSIGIKKANLVLEGSRS